MDISYIDIINTIQQFADENNLIVNQKQIKEINDVYNLIKNEKININKNLFETKSLITMITQDVISGSYDRKKTMLQHSDFRHMGYFDRWFKEGTSEDITNVLKSYGISTDIFKGIPRLQNFHTSNVVNGYNVDIIQTADDESPPNANIKIIIDGEVVYDFENIVNRPKTKEEYYEDYSYKETFGKTTVYGKSYTKIENELRISMNKKPVNHIFEVGANTIYETSYQKTFKSGKKATIKQFRYANGRFASKEDRLQILGDYYG